MAVLTMSDVELARLDTLRRVDRGDLLFSDAASLLGISERHVLRLMERLRSGGASALASQRRGRPSNRRLSEALQTTAVGLVREHYADFGPTFAAEKLAEVHCIHLSRETLRKLMIPAKTR